MCALRQNPRGHFRQARTSAAVGGSLGSCAANERCTSWSCEHVAIARSCAGEAAAATSRRSAAGAAVAAARPHICARALVSATAASGASDGLFSVALSSSWRVLHAPGTCMTAAP